MSTPKKPKPMTVGQLIEKLQAVPNKDSRVEVVFEEEVRYSELTCGSEHVENNIDDVVDLESRVRITLERR